MKKFNHISNRNQVQSSCQSVINISSLGQDNLIELYVKSFSTYKKSVLVLLNYYLSFYKRGQNIFPSNAHIVKTLGYKKRTIQYAKRFLIDAGLITSEQRHGVDVCRINLSPFFKNKYVRACLSYFLPALKGVCLSLLLSSPLYAHLQRPERKNCTLLYYRDMYLKNISSIGAVSNNSNSVVNAGATVQPVKKDCSMSGILAGVMTKLGQDKHVEPPKAPTNNPRDMLEPEVFKIKEIPLTKWGQIRLSAFEDDVLKVAHEGYNRNLTGKAAFADLYRIAMEESRKRGIEPRWKRVEKLAENWNQPHNASMVLQTTTGENSSIETQERSTERTKDKNHQWSTTAPPYKQPQHTHMRPEYIPYQEPNRPEEKPIYIDYFTVEDGYKASGNPLGFPNRYKKRYEEFLADALASTDVSRETMEAELYDMYIQQKGK